ncbi:DUF192 domain-containing protein [Lutimaribacter sp. EGI FJ00015]|uniref:DUF192 domain-containing protein n=1 Tax=Lutimaribacter degradans TaxID=2945989 RepID=A0ACC5ZS45_9RHOB|nr:DUF192 domain-containing protein [Lutimaribacter sp. EGI FJ00013]MCM2561131.1 DUF192 domain-containing protein [Lutimaribacter sp. EGI FJ00013]MCO0611920.1 DUF192 domain-containing protein [Lutimaribacter sp. EGI FJ00015]
MSRARRGLGFAALLLLVLGLAGTVTGPVRADTAACAPGVVHLRGDWGRARFSVDLAQTPREQARGLMFVEQMPRSRGMLFIYPRPQSVSFWMKNTLIPLDMIFLDSTGTVRHVHHDAVPGDLTPIRGGREILVVLEINAGLARELGIAPGSEMRHPAFDREDAAWPC